MPSKDRQNESLQSEKQKPSKRGISRTTGLALLILLVGLSVLLYPQIAAWVNARSSSGIVSTYVETVDQMEEEKKEALLAQARQFNTRLITSGSIPGILDPLLQKDYVQAMETDAGKGILGTLEISKIDVSLPIYKGSDEASLKNGIGHLEGTSLPVGGVGTHAVLTGHRGLPSATLLSHLDEMEEGDVFVIHTIGTTLTYQVDAIHVVDPEDTTLLGIDRQKDQVTLVTCTPYGVNTHRLLVTGHRVSNDLDLSGSSPDASLISRNMVAFVLWGVLTAGICMVWLLFSKRKKRKGMDDEEMFDDSI